MLLGNPAPTSEATFSAPWWGVPVIAGTFLILVAALTFLANLILKRLELARNDRSKWDSEILELALQVTQLTDEMAAVGTEGNAQYKENISDRLPVYTKNLQSMGPPVEKLGLIASPQLSKAATALMLSAMNQGLRHDYSNLPEKERKEQQKKAARIPTLSSAREEFTKAIRKELRAKG